MSAHVDHSTCGMPRMGNDSVTDEMTAGRRIPDPRARSTVRGVHPMRPVTRRKGGRPADPGSAREIDGTRGRTDAAGDYPPSGGWHA
jgi:hypothetical protein